MYKLDELDELNLLDPIQARLNERGDVSQEQQNLLKNSPSLVISILRHLWSNVTFLGLFLAGFILLIGFEAELSMLGIYAAVMLVAGIIFVTIQELPTHKKRKQIQRDIASRKVRVDNGTLVFKDNTHQMNTGNRLLLLSRKRNGLFPGMLYRIFYLEESEVVLSVEEKEPLGEEVERQSYQSILSAANQFKPEAIELNRKGHLSRSGQWRQFEHDLIPGVIIFFAFIGISIYLFGQYSKSVSEGNDGIINLICAGITILIGLAGLYSFTKAVIDIMRNQVISVTGECRKAARMARKRSFFGKTQEENPISFYYSVEGILFRVKESAYLALIDGIRCTAYYTPTSKTLVNIEPGESPLSQKSKT